MDFFVVAIYIICMYFKCTVILSDNQQTHLFLQVKRAYTSFENNRSKLFSEILPPFIWISSLLSNGRQSAWQSVITTLLGCRIGLLNVKTKDKHDDGEWSLDTSTHRVGDGHLEIIRSNLMIQMVENFFLKYQQFFTTLKLSPL